MAINIEGANVTDVLLDTGWVRVMDFRVQSVNVAGVKWPTAATFETEHGYTSVPASSVLGVRGTRPRTPEELAEAKAAEVARADAMLRWQTYAPDRETHDRLYAEQDGKCKGCGTRLDEVRFRHYVLTKDGPELLCHHGVKGCSPLAPRYGQGLV